MAYDKVTYKRTVLKEREANKARNAHIRELFFSARTRNPVNRIKENGVPIDAKLVVENARFVKYLNTRHSGKYIIHEPKRMDANEVKRLTNVMTNINTPNVYSVPAGNIYDDAVNPTHKVKSELSEEDLQTLALEKEKQDDKTSSINQAIQKDYQKYLQTQTHSTGFWNNHNTVMSTNLMNADSAVDRSDKALFAKEEEQIDNVAYATKNNDVLTQSGGVLTKSANHEVKTPQNDTDNDIILNDAFVSDADDKMPTEDNSEYLVYDEPEEKKLPPTGYENVNVDVGQLTTVSKAKKVEMEKGTGRKTAWLAYILFFIPLLFKRKNSFVKFHVIQGLKIDILTLVGLACFFVGSFVQIPVQYGALIMMVVKFVGLIIAGVGVVTKIIMMIVAMCGGKLCVPWIPHSTD